MRPHQQRILWIDCIFKILVNCQNPEAVELSPFSPSAAIRSNGPRFHSGNYCPSFTLSITVTAISIRIVQKIYLIATIILKLLKMLSILKQYFIGERQALRYVLIKGNLGFQIPVQSSCENLVLYSDVSKSTFSFTDFYKIIFKTQKMRYIHKGLTASR